MALTDMLGRAAHRTLALHMRVHGALVRTVVRMDDATQHAAYLQFTGQTA